MAAPFTRTGNIIELNNNDDLLLVLKRQGDPLSGMTLPSGEIVPDAPENTAWIAHEGLIALKLHPAISDIPGFHRPLPDVLVPINPADRVYLETKHEQQLSGETLPGGASVPAGIGPYEWIAFDGFLKLVRVSE